MVMSAMMAGTVGQGASTEFKAYTQIYDELPSIEDIIEHPTKWKVPSEPSRQFAVTTMISHNINEGNVAPLMQAIRRMPEDMQMVTAKDIVKRVPTLRTHEEMRDWIVDISSKIV